jgi:hypothetical protein
MPADAAIGEPAGDIRMTDSTYIKAHVAHEAVATTLAVQKGLNSKLHLAVDGYRIPASGSIADL